MQGYRHFTKVSPTADCMWSGKRQVESRIRRVRDSSDLFDATSSAKSKSLSATRDYPYTCTLQLVATCPDTLTVYVYVSDHSHSGCHGGLVCGGCRRTWRLLYVRFALGAYAPAPALALALALALYARLATGREVKEGVMGGAVGQEVAASEQAGRRAGMHAGE